MELSGDCLRAIYENHRRRFPDLHKSADSVRSQYRPDEVEFMKAVAVYQREHRRPYPRSDEILRVAIALGYRRDAPPAPPAPAPAPAATSDQP